jgi:hypothetical protein
MRNKQQNLTSKRHAFGYIPYMQFCKLFIICLKEKVCCDTYLGRMNNNNNNNNNNNY